MREIPLPDPPGRRPESSQEDVEGGRLTSIVYVMRGRSPFSHLGILDLQAGSLSLRDAKGSQLFAVPVETVSVRTAHRKFFETRRPGFEVHADDRWWFLIAHTVPARYQRRSTRELVERYHARELAPQPSGISDETYLRLTRNPTQHQALWAGYWLSVLGRAGRLPT
jgi:hypothetical protein